MPSQEENDRNAQRIQRITWVGAEANLLLAITKIVVGFFARSQALVADGVHSFSDLATDAAIIIGARFWNAPADERHPYGHGRIETLINVGIGVLLGSIALGIGWQAFNTIYTGQEREAPEWMAFWVAVLSIVVKEALFRWTVHYGYKCHSRAVVANAWHHRSDALSSIPVAVAVVGAHWLPNVTHLDSIAALVVTAMLLKAAWEIAWPSIRELLETREDIDLERRIIEYGGNWTEIDDIHSVRSRRIGGVVLIDCHMHVAPEMTVATSHELAESFQQHVIDNEQEVADVLVHIEPTPERDSQ